MAVDTARDMEEVNKVLDMFKELELRYNAAGRLWCGMFSFVRAVVMLTSILQGHPE